MIVFHASNVKITRFRFGPDGVHVGGLLSALEAALRKTNHPDDVIYVHKIRIPNDLPTLVCDDEGNAVRWRKVITQALDDGYDLIKYVNKYEQDKTPSYIMLDSRVDPVILNTTVYTIEDAEEALDAEW
jgi:hypothetical protein